MVDAIGKETIVSISKAGPELKAKVFIYYKVKDVKRIRT
jgi:hypothetical protein